MKWHALFVASLLGVVAAQDPPVPAPAPAGGESKPKPKDRITERADDMRDQIDKGRFVRSHVKVRVRLKNGNKLIGVVKDGRLVERVDGLRFVDAQARDEGAGIRLWYSGGTRNYVFIPFAQFHSYEVVGRLSQQQLADMELDMQMAEKRAEERAAEQAQKAQSDPYAPPTLPDGTGGPPSEVGKPDAKKDAKKGVKDAKNDAEGGAGKENDAQEQQRAWFSLLQQYPPAAGWNQQKRDEISRRRAVIGAVPSENEQAFVTKFDEWLKACKHFGVDPAPQVEPENDGRRRRR
jgi:hypothetical protein